MKKPWNLPVFPLSNVWWIDIHNTLTICLFCTRCLKERQRKVNLSDRISYALRFSFSLMYSNTQFRTKHSLNLKLRQLITDTVTMKRSKYLMHVKRAYVFINMWLQSVNQCVNGFLYYYFLFALMVFCIFILSMVSALSYTCKQTQQLPTLLVQLVGRFCVSLHVAKNLIGFKLCATTPNNILQVVKTDATCKI